MNLAAWFHAGLVPVPAQRVGRLILVDEAAGSAGPRGRTAVYAGAAEAVEQSWRERGLNAKALAKSLRATIRERDARISDLTGQLYDPDGNHLAERNTELRSLIRTLNQNLRNAEAENSKLRRSLDAARANVKRERERNVTQLFVDT